VCGIAECHLVDVGVSSVIEQRRNLSDPLLVDNATTANPLARLVQARIEEISPPVV